MNLTKGMFSLNLGFVQLQAELCEEDRQCAWELYTELSTRVAVTGKIQDNECTNFNGEIYIESLASLYSYFQEARVIMKKYPVGKINVDNTDHLGVMISRTMDFVLRPFLEKWQSKYRFWWEDKSNQSLIPLERQEQFPYIDEFLSDWASLRWLMKEFQKELINIYKLIDVNQL